jgi:hypothetical protein
MAKGLRLLVCLYSISLGFSLAAQPARDKLALLMAQKVVDALEHQDYGYLSKIVDPEGITLGIDSDPISAAQFRKELREKTNSYCVLFQDVVCPNIDGASLQQELETVHHLKFRMSHLEDNSLEVGIVGSDDSDEELFTLYFTYRSGNWTLQSIDYV